MLRTPPNIKYDKRHITQFTLLLSRHQSQQNSPTTNAVNTKRKDATECNESKCIYQ